MVLMDRPGEKRAPHVTGAIGPRGASLAVEVAW
jgi:hypothetical protein